MVERFNKTLANMLAMYVSTNQTDWDILIPYCVFAYNTSRHELNTYSPHYMMFGREATLPIDAMCRSDEVEFVSGGQYTRDIIERMRIANGLAERNQRVIANEYMVKSLERPPTQFEKGDKVLLRAYTTPFGKVAKLSKMWKGPYEILEKLGPVTYQIGLPKEDGGVAKQIVHANRLKKFHERADEVHAADRVDDVVEREVLLTVAADQQDREEDVRELADQLESAEETEPEEDEENVEKKQKKEKKRKRN